jgi:hypothetical protein
MSEGDAINFSTFILGLASTTLIHLGAAPHPETSSLSPDLPLARQSLELLELLQVKTKGNLTVEEERLFSNLLTDLRLRFVNLTKSK